MQGRPGPLRNNIDHEPLVYNLAGDTIRGTPARGLPGEVRPGTTT